MDFTPLVELLFRNASILTLLCTGSLAMSDSCRCKERE
jgi:hypothetical protein